MLGNWREHMYPSAIRIAEDLYEEIKNRRAAGEDIHPEQGDIFRALQLTSPNEVRAVIVGQDPYHGTGQANGLAFSVNPGIPLPPSLKNIFKELHDDLGYAVPESGDLSKWAERGVLLLNTVLTVRHREANSHRYLGWQRVTEEVINVCMELPQVVVFIEWGAYAQRIVEPRKPDGSTTKFSIASTHPSPLSAYSATSSLPSFIGSKPFSSCNSLLESNGGNPVDWSLS